MGPRPRSQKQDSAVKARAWGLLMDQELARYNHSTMGRKHIMVWLTINRYHSDSTRTEGEYAKCGPTTSGTRWPT
jgi:hypothetical protein